MYFSVLDSRGLFTYANPLGQQSVPGSMIAANNVNCDEIGVTTSRRGFEFYSSQQFDVTNGYITKLFVYRNNLFASFNDGQFAKDNGSGTWTTYTGFTMQPPPDGFLHQMLAGGNSYFTTSNGVYKLSGNNSNPPIPAGAPVALDTEVTISAIIASGFLNAQSQCAYQVVWGYVDEENLQIVGAPSYSAIAANTAAASPTNNVNTTVVFTVPPFVISNSTLPWFYQIYRTPNTGSLSVPPGNNFQLVTQQNATNTDYTNRYVSYTDTVLDSLLGAALYTADGQPNVGNPFNQPPLCQDAAYFSNMAFFANYSTLHNVFITLDAVGAPLGIQVGDTLSITDSTSSTTYTYTGGASNNPTTRTFEVYTGGTPAENIQVTANNIVTVINRDPNNSLFIAQYTSAYGALPGQIQLFAQNLSQAFFSVTTSRTTCWTPTIPTSGTTYASENATVPNGVFVSVLGQPESVPPSFLISVGSPNFPIQRIIPVRTALIVVKAEEGVFQITGTTPQTLTVTTIDTTAFINGSETMVPLNNAGYFFTTQGVMQVNESGCEIMSRNIQGDILALASNLYPNFPQLAFGLGYQSDNAYILFCQQEAADTYSTVQYRYNWITQAWTTWDIPCTAAVINTDNDKMYLATPEGYILEERKTFTNDDFADQTIQINITSIGTNTFTLTSSANVKAGDQISQTNLGTTYTCFIISNDSIANIVTVDTTFGFQTGTAAASSAITNTVSFMPTTAGYNAFIKKFQTWNFEFTNINFTSCVVSFTTDFYPTPEYVTITPKLAGTWGSFLWGANPWGVTNAAINSISTYATKNTAVGHWANCTIELQQAFSGFGLCGFAVFYDFLGQRSR